MNETDFRILQQLHTYCLEIVNRIERYNINEARFLEDSALFDMLLMPVFQIGELSNALSDTFRENHSEIPWHALRGFRNVIGHDYGVVDPQWAWNTIQCDIPQFTEFLENEIDF